MDTSKILAAFGEGDGRSPAQRVRDCVAAMFGLEPIRLIGRCRERDVVKVRHLAMWAVRRCCPGLSYPAVGRVFGGRDHSTIIHAVQATEARFERDPAFAALGRCIAESIGDRAQRFTLDDGVRARIAAAVAEMFPAEVPAAPRQPAPPRRRLRARNDFSEGRRDGIVRSSTAMEAMVAAGTRRLGKAIVREGVWRC